MPDKSLFIKCVRLPIHFAALLFLASSVLAVDGQPGSNSSAGAAKPKVSKEEQEFDRLSALCNQNWHQSRPEDRLQNCRLWLDKYTKPTKGLRLSKNGLRNGYDALAYANYQLNDFYAAQTDAETALKHGDGTYITYFVLGATQVERGADEDGAQNLTVSLKLLEWWLTRLYRGKAYLRMSNYDAAIIDFNAIEQAKAATPEARLDMLKARSKAYVEAKKYDEAVADYTKLLALDPKDPGWDIKLAAIHSKRGDDAKALEAVNRALAMAPKNYKALCLRSQIYAKSTDLKIQSVEKAIDDLERTVEIADEKANADGEKTLSLRERLNGSKETTNSDSIADDCETHSDLAKLFAQKGDLPAAIAAAGKHLEKHATDANVYQLRSEYHQRNRDLDKALLDAEKAVELASASYANEPVLVQRHLVRLAAVKIAQGDAAPGLAKIASTWNSPLVERVGIINLVAVLPSVVTLDDAQRSADWLNEMKKAIPEYEPKNWRGSAVDCEIAQILLAHAPDRALEIYQKIRQPQPECAHVGEFRVYARRRNLDAMVASASAVIGSKSLDVYAWAETRAELYLAIGKTELALGDARKMIELRPRDGRGILIHSLIDEANGKYDQALLKGEQLAKDYPRWGGGHYAQARNLLHLKRFDEAFEAGTKALALAQSSEQATYLFVLGRIEQARGNSDQAVAMHVQSLSVKGAYSRVASYQFALNKSGHYKGGIDGIATRDLETAVASCIKQGGCKLDSDY